MTTNGMLARAIAAHGPRVAAVLAFVWALSGFAPALRAQTPPAHMNVIIGHAATAPAQVAQENVLALNVAMFSYYDGALKLYQQRLLAQHPVILALFSGAGGNLTLYRPGMAPLRAPSSFMV